MSKPNSKRYISPLQFNISNLYLVLNPNCSGVTTTTGMSSNPGFTSEYCPEDTGRVLYPVGTSGWYGVGMYFF